MNDNASPAKRCPRCSAALPADAPEGLCPRCLASLNLSPETVFTGDDKPAAPMPAPQELAPYFPQLDIIESLGRGGMGVVYKARQRSLDRIVALKLLAPERVKDPEFAARFAREAQALARLSHPNIVTVHDFGQAGGFYYLLMEFVDGVNLRELFRTRRLKPEEALAVIPPICEALQYAHDRGIVHRDIKPENLLLDKDGRVKIADFGIAKMLSTEPGASALTEDKAVGTPTYMAPEQLENPREVDNRADIYSLGVVLYEMLTGELPLGKFQPPSRKIHIDVRLDEIVLRALEKEPELRYQTASQVRTAVESVTGHAVPPVPSRTSIVNPAEPPRPRAVLRSSRCYISTPEHLKTYFGLMYIYTGSGELKLDVENLTYMQGGVSQVIPLRAISDLSIGRYPWAAKPTGLDYISITYTENGASRTQLFTPNNGGFKGTWVTNRVVAEWHEAILEMTTSAAGRAPKSTPAKALSGPSEATWPQLLLFTSFPLSILAMIAFTFIIALSFQDHRNPSWRNVFTTLFIVLIGMGFAVGATVRFFGSRRNNPRSSKTDLNPWPRRIFWLISAIVCVPAGLIFLALLIPAIAKQRAMPTRTAPPPYAIEAPMPPGAPVPTYPATAPQATPLNSVRIFSLRHKLASEMTEDLRQILLGRPGQTASASPNNQELVVNAPPEVLNRVAAFIYVTDWPAPMKNVATGEYLRDDPLTLSRSLFHACAIEDYDGVAGLLSLRTLAELKGETKRLPEFGSPFDEALARELHSDWPGKQAAIQKLAKAWMQYPLRQLRQESGIAIGFGLRYFVSAAFDNSPKDVISINVIADRNGVQDQPLVIDTLPPWLSSSTREER